MLIFYFSSVPVTVSVSVGVNVSVSIIVPDPASVAVSVNDPIPLSVSVPVRVRGVEDPAEICSGEYVTVPADLFTTSQKKSFEGLPVLSRNIFSK